MHTRTRVAVILAVLSLVLRSGAVWAQEAGQTGISMGYPGAIGLIYHVSDSVGVRPEFSFTKDTSSSSSFLPVDTSGWATSIGASALFYFGRRDEVRTYVAPRFAYSRISTTAVSTISGTVINTSGNHSDAYSGTGSFGAQYTPTRRFGIFGEVGLSYTRSTFQSGTTAFDVTTKSWGTRTAVGAILYF